MEFLKAQTTQPKTLADYKHASFKFDATNVHPIDQLEMHKQIGEMISSTITSTSMNLFKIQVALSNAQFQMKMGKISSQSKDNKIMSLEDLMVKIRYDPSDVK